MITNGEIRKLSLLHGVRPETIEKDYVLGWMLAGIHHAPFSKNWVFKGGTALKKCYFHDYRFSEDLDFSLKDPAVLTEEALGLMLNELADWVYESAGIEISKSRTLIETFENRDKRQVAQVRLYYHGPISPSAPNQWARIKLDLTTGELLTDTSLLRDVYHPYSDVSEVFFKIRSYSFTEIFAEKLRAFIERMRPRDVYDVVKCYEAGIADLAKVKEQFLLKMEAKSLKIPDKETLLTQVKTSENFWEEQLAHQITPLEAFGEFERKIEGVLERLL